MLAALDLAEPEPLWPMVIERLRLAAAGEGNAGRARAALVYALAQIGRRGGREDGARQARGARAAVSAGRRAARVRRARPDGA